MGAMLAATERAKGAKGNPGGRGAGIVRSPVSTAQPTLAQLGLTKNESARAQALFELPNGRIKILPRFRDMIPPVSEEEKRQFEENLVKDGCRDPLVTWNGILIDGHNRFEICQRNGIGFETLEMSFESDEDAKVWIIRNQFGRRNISPFTRVQLVLKLEPLLKLKAKEQQVRKPKSVPQNSAKQKPIETREELAKIAGVSHDTIAKGKVVDRRATEEIKWTNCPL